MTEKLTPYQKRCQKEEKMKHFFTYTCNSGGLQQVLGITGIKVHKNPSALTQNLFEWYKAEIKQEQNN